MSRTLLDWLTVLSACCWPVSFWWMHRISVKQNALIADLTKETSAVRKLSKEEHAAIQKLEPQVKEIHEKVR